MENSKKAVFTKFPKKTNWCDGKVGNLNFQAKLFDTGSDYGINGGRVSKLAIWNKDGTYLVNYDRGWDIEPTEAIKPYYDAVMALLENAPKRF
jgi:hypothetical protein